MNINVAGNYTLELNADSFLTNTSNIYLQCKTTGAPVNITLPRITTLEGVTTTWGFKIYINDADGNASVNNITLIPHPADKINGSGASVILNTNNVTGHIQPTGIIAWEFSLGSSSSGSSGSLLFNSTADKVVSANGVQSILPATGIGTSIIPANFLTNGKKLSIRIVGTFLVPDGGNFINPTLPSGLFTLKVGGMTIVVSDISISIPADNVVAGFSVQLELTYRSAGSVLLAGGQYIINNGNGSFVASSAVVNPLVANQVDVEKDFGGATITTTIMSIESPSLI